MLFTMPETTWTTTNGPRRKGVMLTPAGDVEEDSRQRETVVER